MNLAEMDGRYQRDASALQAAKGLMMNKSFFLLFFICFVVAVVGLLTVGISGVPGWIVTALTLVLGAGAAFSGRADTVMTMGVALVSGLIGIGSIIVTVLVVIGVR